MKSLRLTYFISLIICALPISLIGQGLRLTLSVPDLPEKEVILSHRLGMKFYTDDTIKTDNRGSAVFESGEPMPAGMYQLVFPDKKFVEFFLDKDQVFGISTKISALTDNLRFNGSAENSRFHEWQQQYALKRSSGSAIQSRLKKGNLSPDSIQLLNKELHQIQVSVNQIWDSAINDLAGTLAGNFIRGLKPAQVPDSFLKANTQEGQLRQYQFVRAHFFDNIDFTDEGLLRTPLIENKLDQYFKQVVPPVPDTIISDARKIIELSKPAINMYQFVVQYIFNLYTDPEIMGTDAVYVYIAENYYLTGQTPWIDSANLRGINARVKELKPLLLGKVAPALDGLVNTEEQPVELNEIKSKYLILYFWSPDCGFCKESTPKLYSQYEDLKKLGIEIVALNTRLDKQLWLTFISENQLSWINVYSPVRIKFMIDKYQAFSTPIMYILDSERRIIAKNISVDQVKPFFTQYLARQKSVD